MLIGSSFLAFNASALGRLVRRDFVYDELPSLLEDILENKDVSDAIRWLPKGHAQIIIDIIDKVRSV